MTKHRTALILQALILAGLLIAAAISAPKRASATSEARVPAAAATIQLDEMGRSAGDRD